MPSVVMQRSCLVGNSSHDYHKLKARTLSGRLLRLFSGQGSNSKVIREQAKRGEAEVKKQLFFVLFFLNSYTKATIVLCDSELQVISFITTKCTQYADFINHIFLS